MTKPSVFIGSSSEALKVAHAIEFQLQREAEITIWNDGSFALGRVTLESLVDSLETYDFAIFVLSADDLTTSRGISSLSPRDNVLFEIGLFMGCLGRARTFMVCSIQERIKLPTDLAGITVAMYDGDRSDGNVIAAVGPACTLIRRAIESLSLNERKGGRDSCAYEIKILSPAQDEVKYGRFEVTGSYEIMPRDGLIYLFISSPDDGEYWPQGAVRINSDSKRWSGYVALYERPSREANIIVAKVGGSGRILCDYYTRVGHETSRYFPLLKLPMDIVECDRVKVFKERP